MLQATNLRVTPSFLIIKYPYKISLFSFYFIYEDLYIESTEIIQHNVHIKKLYSHVQSLFLLVNRLEEQRHS